MQDGAIEQMAPPRELYGESTSVFGGWFLGNPGMDFVPIAGNREVAMAVTGGPIPDAVMTLGFRPEHVQLVSADASTGVLATVQHAALVTGGQRLVNLQSGELTIKAKLPWDSALKPVAGDTVKWSVTPSRIRMFDENEIVVGSAPIGT
jgi:ABC-type sugar transport system ATPase subunit